MSCHHHPCSLLLSVQRRFNCLHHPSFYLRRSLSLIFKLWYRSYLLLLVYMPCFSTSRLVYMIFQREYYRPHRGIFQSTLNRNQSDRKDRRECSLNPQLQRRCDFYELDNHQSQAVFISETGKVVPNDFFLSENLGYSMKPGDAQIVLK